MNQTTLIYKVHPRAISETLEGETIIINLESGTYYSLNASGSVVWNFLMQGASENQVCDYFAQTTTGTDTEIRTTVASLFTTLKQDGLITETPDGSFSFSKPETKISFVAPTTERYEDMQEMLLADPIHDVDTAGWPTKKAE